MMNDVVKASFEVMGKGMLSIFIVIFILAAIVMLLAKVTNSKYFKKDEAENED